uniref:Putative secreted protein n=1 Tax=Ixodes ricinus TaxID=34613 RepID=A0A6B0UQ35_IXORI
MRTPSSSNMLFIWLGVAVVAKSRSCGALCISRSLTAPPAMRSSWPCRRKMSTSSFTSGVKSARNCGLSSFIVLGILRPVGVQVVRQRLWSLMHRCGKIRRNLGVRLANMNGLFPVVAVTRGYSF